MGKMFFNILATSAEFEADLIRMRTREGMAIARAKGKLRGKQPKLSENRTGNVHDGKASVAFLGARFEQLGATLERRPVLEMRMDGAFFQAG